MDCRYCYRRKWYSPLGERSCPAECYESILVQPPLWLVDLKYNAKDGATLVRYNIFHKILSDKKSKAYISDMVRPDDKFIDKLNEAKTARDYENLIDGYIKKLDMDEQYYQQKYREFVQSDKYRIKDPNYYNILRISHGSAMLPNGIGGHFVV